MPALATAFGKGFGSEARRWECRNRGTLSPMALTADIIAGHPALHGAIRQQSRLLLEAYEANPRLASVFATQQRWLMAQTALALHFRIDAAVQPGGLTAARFFEAIARNGVASRNTADAFVKEMLKYGYAQRAAAGVTDRRTHPLEPTQASVDAVRGWLMVHLSTLDRLDGADGGGRRLATFLGNPGVLAALQPLIADGLLSSNQVRTPERTFSLFTWLDNGGIVMDWLIAGIEEAATGAERIPTGIVSVAAMAAWLKLSRTHLARKLREAEQLGSIGWQGKRGCSVMWVSDGFRREYAAAQAVKLAIIDAAFDAYFGRSVVGAASTTPNCTQ
jgi:hypothetical protein